ncbi:hypothetical protein BB559_000684 [Furculomyces boomerangus]|uniref:GYF domain-containing protein n=1 Tax=Furculomyces boomerangus TaxID=61424 RepID=A0A2T9Z4C3_9FUNG|nr:hypothetical protein BB559_000684 [Furculomyces boomerangus]
MNEDLQFDISNKSSKTRSILKHSYEDSSSEAENSNVSSDSEGEEEKKLRRYRNIDDPDVEKAKKAKRLKESFENDSETENKFHEKSNNKNLNFQNGKAPNQPTQSKKHDNEVKTLRIEEIEEAFNMKEEYKEGNFDEEGNFIWNKKDSDEVYDVWMADISKKDIKAALKAQLNKDKKSAQEIKDLNQKSIELFGNYSIETKDDLSCYLAMILEENESIISTLGKLQKLNKKLFSNKNRNAKNKTKETSDISKTEISKKISQLTEIGDRLLLLGCMNCYEWTKESLIDDLGFKLKNYIKKYEPNQNSTVPILPVNNTETNMKSNNISNEINNEPSDTEGGGLLDDLHTGFEGNIVENTGSVSTTSSSDIMWEYKWSNNPGVDTWGPFPSSNMQSWKDGGFFNEETVVRKVGDSTFTPALKTNF